MEVAFFTNQVPKQISRDLEHVTFPALAADWLHVSTTSFYHVLSCHCDCVDN